MKLQQPKPTEIIPSFEDTISSHHFTGKPINRYSANEPSLLDPLTDMHLALACDDRRVLASAGN